MVDFSRLPERFRDKVSVLENGCWEWTGSRLDEGYGQVRVNGKKLLAHRFAYELLVGPIPDGLEPDHTCRNPSCVNPEHLDVITHRDNILRGDRKSMGYNTKKTHCPKGHPYDENNTYVNPRGERQCKQCQRERNRLWMREHKGDKELPLLAGMEDE